MLKLYSKLFNFSLAKYFFYISPYAVLYLFIFMICTFFTVCLQSTFYYVFSLIFISHISRTVSRNDIETNSSSFSKYNNVYSIVYLVYLFWSCRYACIINFFAFIFFLLFANHISSIQCLVQCTLFIK